MELVKRVADLKKSSEGSSDHELWIVARHQKKTQIRVGDIRVVLVVVLIQGKENG